MPSPQTLRNNRLKPLFLLIGSALLIAACGGDSVDDQASPGSLPFDDTVETLDGIGEDIDADSAAPTSTSTTVAVAVPVSEPASTDPVEPAEPEVVFGEDLTAGVLAVVNVADDDVLNIRSGPGVVNDIIGTLGPDARNIEPTNRTATVDGVLWREISHINGTTGFVHSNFVQFGQPCNDEPSTGTVIFSDLASGDVDGDGTLDDLMLLVRDDATYLEINLGDAGTVSHFMGEPERDVLDGFASMELSAPDIDGNGKSEIRIDTNGGRWTGTQYFRLSSDCEVWAYGNGGSVFHLGFYGSAGSPQFWGCQNFGTPDFRIIQTIGGQTEDGMTFTIFTYGFDIDEGFVNVADAPPLELSAEEFESYEITTEPCELT